MQYITLTVLQIASQIHFLGFLKDQNAKLYWFFCSANHRGDSHGSNYTTSVRRTRSFCKYGLVLFLSLVYMVYCRVSVVIFTRCLMLRNTQRKKAEEPSLSWLFFA